MSKADITYQEMLNQIYFFGTSTENGEVRPIWADTNEPAYTKKQFALCNRYDLREEFPLLTVRKQGWKNCIDEILWIWQKGSNNIEELNSHIWDQWAGVDNTIGKAYGYQVAVPKQTIRTTKNKARSIMGLPALEQDEKIEWKCNQIQYILHELKYNPFSRRIIGNLYNIQDLDEMNLHPCCFLIQFNVIEEETENGPKRRLDMILMQRSADTIVAGGWNVAQYAALLWALADLNGYEPGVMTHMIGDAHIYDRHMDIAKEIIEQTGKKAPTFKFNPKGKKSFFELTVDDFIIENYEYVLDIKGIPVAK